MDEWLKLIILAVVFAGPAFGKKLIEAFTKDESSPEEAARRRSELPQPSARREPAHPAAKPMPGHRPSAAPIEHAETQPRPVAPPARPIAPPARKTPTSGRSGAPARRPTSAPLPSEQQRSPFRGAPPHRTPVEPPRAERDHGERKATRGRSRGKARNAEERAAVAKVVAAAKAAADAESHSVMDVQTEPAVEAVEVSEFDSVLHPGKAEMRRAILMSEILAPPLALRCEDGPL